MSQHSCVNVHLSFLFLKLSTRSVTIPKHISAKYDDESLYNIYCQNPLVSKAVCTSIYRLKSFVKYFFIDNVLKY